MTRGRGKHLGRFLGRCNLRCSRALGNSGLCDSGALVASDTPLQKIFKEYEKLFNSRGEKKNPLAVNLSEVHSERSDTAVNPVSRELYEMSLALCIQVWELVCECLVATVCLPCHCLHHFV